MADRGYINLLSHLNRAAATLPLETIQASIAHYLAHVQPLPTAFTAIVISSQLFRALSLPKLEALSTAFRHGVHFKFKLLQDEPGGLFSRSMRGKLGEWVHSVLKGLQGGQTMLRLAAYDGLLLGLEDLESEVNAKEGRMRGKVEEELVVALAEAMDMYPLNASSVGWEKEFVPSAGHQTESTPVFQLTRIWMLTHRIASGITLSVAYLIISRSLPLVASHRLKALPLGVRFNFPDALISDYSHRRPVHRLSPAGCSLSSTPRSKWVRFFPLWGSRSPKVRTGSSLSRCVCSC